MKILHLRMVVVLGTALRFSSAADVPKLEIYVVAKEPKSGWQYYDSSKFPNLGYIASQPDILITRIEDVHVENTRQRSNMVDCNGSTESTDEWQPTLVIKLLPNDAKKLSEMVTVHLGGQLLFLMDNEPLFAPMLWMGIEGPSIAIPISPRMDVEKIRVDLQRLCE